MRLTPSLTRRAEEVLMLVNAYRKNCLDVGAGGRSRTLDLRITNALLYQLSYTGTKLEIIADPKARLCTTGVRLRSGLSWCG